MRLIDADALEEILEKVPAADIRNMGGQAYVLVKLSQVFNAIDNQPTIEERKTGRWIRTKMPVTGAIEHRCSRCDTPYYMAFAVEMNYCPNCGAKMDGGGNDSET